jgi:dTDP-4-dehydrorhamnose reductase
VIDVDLLVVGGDSLIGGVLAAMARAQGLRVLTTTRRPGVTGDDVPPLDLANPADWGWLSGVRAHTAVLCAAVARLDACHLDPEGTARINVTGAVELGRRLMAAGTHVIHLSSNQVFGGDNPAPVEDTAVSPANVYGQQKAAAERGLLALAPPLGTSGATILRLTKVIHPGMALIQGWLDALAQGREIRPARDMALAAVTVDLVAETVLALAHLGRSAPDQASRIFHLSAADEVSYAEAAAFVARRVGADPALIQPVEAVAAGYLREQPPRHTIMAGDHLRAATGITPPGVHEALAACLP